MADGGNSRIMKWTTNYTDGGVCVVGCTGVAGSGATQLRTPRDLKFDASGNLYVSDQGNHRIQKFMIQYPTSGCSISEYARRKNINPVILSEDTKIAWMSSINVLSISNYGSGKRVDFCFRWLTELAATCSAVRDDWAART